MLGSIIGVGGSLLGGLFASRGSKSAARTQAQGATQAQQMQRDMFDQQRQDFAPWRRQGENALRALRGELGLGPMPAGYAGFEETPGFQFGMSQGMRNLNSQLAAMGLTDSGAGLRARQEFGQGLASLHHDNHLARLQSMGGLGQTATNAMAGLGSQFAGNMGNLAMARGNALAGGQANAANAWGSAFEGGMGALGQYFGNQGQPQTAQAMNAFVPAFGPGGTLNNMIPMGGGFRS